MTAAPLPPAPPAPGVPPMGVGGGGPNGGGPMVPAIPLPKAVQVSPDIRNLMGGAAKGVYFAAYVKKVNAAGGKASRCIVLSPLFFFQLDMSRKVTRCLPLNDIERVQYDHPYVVFKARPGSHERDWHFEWTNDSRNTHKTVEEMVKVLNTARTPLMAEGSPPLSLERGIQDPRIGRDSNTWTVKQRMEQYRSNPSLMPQIRNIPMKPKHPPMNPMFDEPLTPAETFNVTLNYASEAFGMEYTVSGQGIRISNIVPDGPINRAGVPLGKIVSINGQQVNTSQDLLQTTEQIRRQASVGQLSFPLVVQPFAGQRREPPRDVPPPPPSKPIPRDIEEVEEHPSANERDDVPEEEEDYDDEEDTEEMLTRKLQRLVSLRKKGKITEETYQASKMHILELLGHNPLAPTPHNENTSQSESSELQLLPPPSRWAKVNINRYIYLRTQPFRGCEWVESDGVTGVVMVLHLCNGYAAVQTDDKIQGYIQAKYLTFLAGPERPQPRKRRSVRSHGLGHRRLSDYFSDEGSDVEPLPLVPGLPVEEQELRPWFEMRPTYPRGKSSERVHYPASKSGASVASSWGPRYNGSPRGLDDDIQSYGASPSYNTMAGPSRMLSPDDLWDRL